DRRFLVERLLDPEQVIVFDGAMGTMLYSKGVFINQCYDELNLRAPALIQEVHRAYVRAGADVIETNTFGANRTKLTPYGLQEQTVDITHAAARIARQLGGANDVVAAPVGPDGV